MVIKQYSDVKAQFRTDTFHCLAPILQFRILFATMCTLATVSCFIVELNVFLEQEVSQEKVKGFIILNYLIFGPLMLSFSVYSIGSFNASDAHCNDKAYPTNSALFMLYLSLMISAFVMIAGCAYKMIHRTAQEDDDEQMEVAADACVKRSQNYSTFLLP